MKSAAKHPLEAERLAALERLNLLDTAPEEEFDEITFIAAQICGTPIALISLVDGTRQWFKSKFGIDAVETPRDLAFCAHAILQDDVFVVSDSRLDERLRDHPWVTSGPQVQFYAGAPLMSPDGFPLGTLCVVDAKPRVLNPEQLRALKVLSNQITRLLSFRNHIQEITERSRDLEILRKAVQHMSDGLMVRRADGTLLDSNPSAQRILEFTPEQFRAGTRHASDWKLMSPDGSPIPMESSPSALALRQGEAQVGVIVGAAQSNGEERWFRVNSSPLFFDDSKTPTHTITTFTDITHEKKMSKRVEATGAELQKILEGIPAGVGYYDTELKLLYANSAYASVFQLRPENIKGWHMSQILGDNLYAQNSPGVEAVLRGEAQTFERELIKNGEVSYFLAKLFPDISQGAVSGLFVVVNEVSDLKRLDIQRRELEAKLVASARLTSLGEMAGGVAHEINTPLTVIQLSIDSIRNESESSSVRPDVLVRGADNIEQAVERIARIINGLRTFARDSKDDRMEVSYLPDIVQATLDLCRERLATNSIELRMDNVPAIKLTCRPGQIAEILMSLINNSFDAILDLEERWIEIEFHMQEDRLEISVTDSGKGIPEPVAIKLMQPFFTTKELGKGTGLALSIARGIASEHKGALEYDRSSKNTRFTLRLPVCP